VYHPKGAATLFNCILSASANTQILNSPETNRFIASLALTGGVLDRSQPTAGAIYLPFKAGEV
jgi:hypothetical protein